MDQPPSNNTVKYIPRIKIFWGGEKGIIYWKLVTKEDTTDDNDNLIILLWANFLSENFFLNGSETNTDINLN